jgi:hypothetical protein
MSFEIQRDVFSSSKKIRCVFNLHVICATSRCSEQRSEELILQISPVTGLEWLRGFQEVKFPRFHDDGTGWW